jgi:hypothetical protein
VVRLAGAGVLSSVFLALPLLVMPRQPPAPTVPSGEATAPAETAAVTTQITGTGPRVVVSTHDVAVPVAAPKLTAARLLRVRDRQSASTLRGKRPILARSKAPSFRGRLARMVAGDGRYSVRPFPTVGN